MSEGGITFEWTAVTRSGEKRSGTMQGESEDFVRERLTQQGMRIEKIRRQKKSSNSPP